MRSSLRAPERCHLKKVEWALEQALIESSRRRGSTDRSKESEERDLMRKAGKSSQSA